MPKRREHGHVLVYIQKARWASDHHATTLQLDCAGGDGFALSAGEPARPERVWNDIAEYVLANGGCSWSQVERAVSGQGEYLRLRRDSMLESGLIVNAGRGQKLELWHRDDPARSTLDATVSELGRGSDAVASRQGDDRETADRVPPSPRKGDGVRDAVGSASPDEPGEAHA